MEKLEAQRARSNLDRDYLADYVLGGNKRRKDIKNIHDSKKEMGYFRDPRVFEMSRTEVVDYTLKRTFELAEKRITLSDGSPITINNFLAEEFSSDNVLFAGGVGWLMTQKMIDVLGTDEQKDLWIKKIFEHILVCCYAQTEIAHGSDV